MRRYLLAVALLACTDQPTAPAGVPFTQAQAVTPIVALLRTVDSLNAAIARFYADSGTIRWIGVTVDSTTGTPTLHFSLTHRSLTP